MDNRQWTIILGIILTVGMYFFSQWYIDLNINATIEFRYLIFAIFSGSIALFLHLFKDFHLVKKKKSFLLMIDSLELLLLIMTPILSVFQIYLKEYPDQMLVLLSIGIFSWWMAVILRTNNDSGKQAFASSAQLYAMLLAIMAIAAWMLALVN